MNPLNKCTIEAAKDIDTLTPAEINREICEREGIPWHELSAVNDDDNCSAKCSCGRAFKYLTLAYMHIDNHDFYANPVAVLKVMEAMPDGKLFFAKLMYQGDNVEAIDDDGYISRHYMTTDGLLAKAALQWLRERGK